MPEETGELLEPSPDSPDAQPMTTPDAQDPTPEGEWKEGDPLHTHPRFREVNSQKNEYKTQAQQAQEQAQKLFDANQQLQAALRESMSQPATTATRSEGDDVLSDPRMRNLRQKFEEGPAGDAAFQDILDVIDMRVEQKTPEAKESLTAEQVSQMVNQGVGRVTATLQTREAMNDLINKGLLDGDNATELATRMKTKVDENPQWGLAEHQSNLLKTVYSEMVFDGKIKPGSRPSRPSPMQPGGRRQADPQKEHDDFLRDIKNDPRFRNTLGRLPIETLREMAPPDSRPSQIVHTDRGDVDSRVLQDSFVHTR